MHLTICICEVMGFQSKCFKEKTQMIQKRLHSLLNDILCIISDIEICTFENHFLLNKCANNSNI